MLLMVRLLLAAAWTSAAPPPLRMTVALYSEPGPTWRRMAAAAKAHPAVKMTALISPNHDQNDCPMAGDDIEKYIAHNQTWLDGLAHLRSSGIRLQHYFHMRNLSCSGEVNASTCAAHGGGCSGLCCLGGDRCVAKYRCCNSVENVTKIVNASVTYFAQDGFFADNGDFGNHEYGQQIYDLTQRGVHPGAPPRAVLMNGGVTDEWPFVHTPMTASSEFTGTTDTRAMRLPSFASKYSRDRFVAIIHSVSNASYMKSAVDAFVKEGWGDLSVVGDYDQAIPPYWEEQVAYIASLNAAQRQ